jgi:2-dehydropantoate 2-reductase
MRIVVVGAGAVGGWYGGKLAEAGHAVHLVTRADATVITAHGLRLRDRQGERVIRVASATADPAALGAGDLVIVAAKSTANADLPALIRPLLGPATTLLTLQNGMGNVEAFRSLLPAERIVAGLCFVCINRLAPGVIENTLSGHVRMAAAAGPANAAVRACVTLFADAGLDCRAEDSLEAVLWKKLCWNVPFNGLAIAAGGLTTDRIVGDPVLRARARRLMDEVAAAAAARGHVFDEKHIRWQFEMTDGMGPYRPSSLIDYLAGREVELEGIWGEPLRRGEAAGVAMPELRTLLNEIKTRLAARTGSLLG